MEGPLGPAVDDGAEGAEGATRFLLPKTGSPPEAPGPVTNVCRLLYRFDCCCCFCRKLRLPLNVKEASAPGAVCPWKVRPLRSSAAGAVVWKLLLLLRASYKLLLLLVERKSPPRFPLRLPLPPPPEAEGADDGARLLKLVGAVGCAAPPARRSVLPMILVYAESVRGVVGARLAARCRTASWSMASCSALDSYRPSDSVQSTLNHQSQMRCDCRKTVPLGHRNEILRPPSQMWNTCNK